MEDRERERVGDLATQIVLINKDLKQITDSIVSIEKQLSHYSNVDKTIITQQSVLDSYERRLSIIEREYADFRKYIMDMRGDLTTKVEVFRESARAEKNATDEKVIEKIEVIVSKFEKRFEEKEVRLRQLENWRWYALGIAFALALVLKGLPWKISFLN